MEKVENKNFNNASIWGMYIASLIFSIYQVLESYSYVIFISYVILWYTLTYSKKIDFSSFKLSTLPKISLLMIFSIPLLLTIVFSINHTFIQLYPFFHFTLYILYKLLECNFLSQENENLKKVVYGIFVYMPFIVYWVLLTNNIEGYSHEVFKVYLILSLFVYI